MGVIYKETQFPCSVFPWSLPRGMVSLSPWHWWTPGSEVRVSSPLIGQHWHHPGPLIGCFKTLFCSHALGGYVWSQIDINMFRVITFGVPRGEREGWNDNEAEVLKYLQLRVVSECWLSDLNVMHLICRVTRRWHQISQTVIRCAEQSAWSPGGI